MSKKVFATIIIAVLILITAILFIVKDRGPGFDKTGCGSIAITEARKLFRESHPELSHTLQYDEGVYNELYEECERSGNFE